MKNYRAVGIPMAVCHQKPPPNKLSSGLYPYADNDGYQVGAVLMDMVLYDTIIKQTLDDGYNIKAAITDVVLKDKVFDHTHKYPDGYTVAPTITNVTLKDTVVSYQEKAEGYSASATVVDMMLYDKVEVVKHHQPVDDKYVVSANIISMTLTNVR